MKAFLKKLGLVALVLGFAALVLGSTGCAGNGLNRPGWIVPIR